MSSPTRILSVQSRLLGNASYAVAMRRRLEKFPEVDVRSVWGDEERLLHERTTIGRIVYRLSASHVRAEAFRRRNIDLYPLRYELGTSYWADRVIARERARNEPQVVHLHTQGLALTARRMMSEIPTVISGDMTSHRTAEQFTEASWRFTHAVQHAFEGRALRAAAALAPFSSYAASSMIRDYGVAPERVFVISPGVDLEEFASVGQRPPTEHSGPRRLLFIGGEYLRKGGDALVRVFTERLAARGDVALDVVTSGESIVEETPLVSVHRNVAPYTSAWRNLFDRAYAFVLPTRREAYGLVYLEAAAAGLPVVGSTVGAGTELVLDGETGYTVDPDDDRALHARLSQLLDDPELARSLGRRGRARVGRDFDAHAQTRKLVDLYRALAASSPTVTRASNATTSS